MHVAAQDRLHLGVPAHHGSEAIAPGEADAVHVRDACEERRVMHQHESRHVALFGQGGVEPGQPLSAQLPPP